MANCQSHYRQFQSCVYVQHLFVPSARQKSWAFPAATPHETETLLQLQHSSSCFSYIPCWAWIPPAHKTYRNWTPAAFCSSGKWLKRLFPRVALLPGKPVFSSLLGEHPQNTHRTTAIETGRQPPTRHLGPVRSRVWQIIWGSYDIIKA